MAEKVAKKRRPGRGNPRTSAIWLPVRFFASKPMVIDFESFRFIPTERIFLSGSHLVLFNKVLCVIEEPDPFDMNREW